MKRANRVLIILLLVGLVIFASCGGNATENKPDEGISPNVSIETQLLNTISKLENESVEPIDMDDVNWIKYVSTSTGQVHLMGYSIGSGGSEKVRWFNPPDIGGRSKIGEEITGDTKGKDFFDNWDNFGCCGGESTKYKTRNYTGVPTVFRLRFGADDTEIKMMSWCDTLGTIKDRDTGDGFCMKQFGIDGTWTWFNADGTVQRGTLDWSDPMWDGRFVYKDTGIPMSEEKIRDIKNWYFECWRKGFFFD